jgi:hypothetical protein
MAMAKRPKPIISPSSAPPKQSLEDQFRSHHARKPPKGWSPY